jgi:hypothetical protein
VGGLHIATKVVIGQPVQPQVAQIAVPQGEAKRSATSVRPLTDRSGDRCPGESWF